MRSVVDPKGNGTKKEVDAKMATFINTKWLTSTFSCVAPVGSRTIRRLHRMHQRSRSRDAPQRSRCFPRVQRGSKVERDQGYCKTPAAHWEPWLQTENDERRAIPSGQRGQKAHVRLRRRSRGRRVNGLTRVGRRRSGAPCRENPVSRRNQPVPARALIAAVTNESVSASIAEPASVRAFVDDSTERWRHRSILSVRPGDRIL
jgi:hypothetical protein